MAYIIHTAEQINIEIRLEVRIKDASTVHIKLILICIKAVPLRMLYQCIRAFIKSLRRHHIVMVTEYDEISLGHLQCRVGIARNASVVP